MEMAVFVLEPPWQAHQPRLALDHLWSEAQEAAQAPLAW